jgi:hypothetical protein
MKKIISIVAIFAMCAGSMRADEGMWLLPLLKQMNGKAIKEAGCDISANRIYGSNKSLKGAIVQFGGGCTGEIVSDEGLLLTNHHCGYSNIQQLSSVDHDYLKDGYWAMTRNEELPCKGLTVTFLEYMEDITPLITKAEEKAKAQNKGSGNAEANVKEAVDAVIKDAVSKAEKKNPHCKVTTTSFYNDNVLYLIVYKTYRDVRFVGAPPSSIGKFGADTDNWMWPRHTGDFSMFRVYADKKNNPADYSPDNVPLSSKNFLKVSVAGVQEGDYTMIMGFPGRTTRFQTSPELKSQLEINDIRIAARTVRQNVLLEDMLADPKVKIQYASKYSSSSNGWKKWQGMKLAFHKLDIIGRAEAEEREFDRWVNSSKKTAAKYGNVLQNLADAMNAGHEASMAYTLASESIYRIEITSFATKMRRLADSEIKSGKSKAEATNIAYEAIRPLYKDYSAPTDRKVAKAMLKFYRDNAKDENLILILKNLDIDAYVDQLFDNTAFSSAESLKKAIGEKGYGVFNDPACTAGEAIMDKTMELYSKERSFSGRLADARHDYTKALLEWNKNKPIYPDANFTMRFTYGTVKGYSPKDAVIYRHYTTLDGVMEKENPDSWEFIVPEKLKTLWKNQDFGKYAMEDGKMPVAFLSNNDITGGNSGSPIMNSKGELIGLAFDGNWESMSSDVMFEPDLQRCINVDIRYVLFIIDKFGGAGHLVKEMKLVK